MTVATEKILSGRQPLWVVEMDLDLCTKTWSSATAATAAAFNDNLVKYSDALDNGVYTLNQVTIDADDTTEPDGGTTADKLVEDGTNNIHYIETANVTFDGASSYLYAVVCKADERTKIQLQLPAAAFPNIPQAKFNLSTGAVISSADVDDVNITSIGSGWYRCWITATSDAGVAAKANVALLDAAGNAIYQGDGASGAHAWRLDCRKDNADAEGQYTEALDGSSTNVRLTTAPLTRATDYDLFFDTTEDFYEGDGKSGTEWLRVQGDATGESASDTVKWSEADEFCRAAATSGECFNTRATCDFPTDYDVTSSVLTYKFCQTREGVPASEGLIPSLVSVDVSPTKITVGRGLGERAQVTMRFKDHPHHDRGGMDPYLSTRSYVPEDQGTFWGKFIARNKYYQGRTVRVRSGYISDSGFDLANDFNTRTYFLESISGPNANGIVTVTAKDILKLADDKRSQAPTPNSGVLDADINAVVLSATLSPAGIGNEEYAASGTVVIGSETMTFTRAADVLTIARHTDGTTAAAHDAGDLVQECLRYTAQDLDDIITDLLTNYAGVDSAYIVAADWQAQMDEWLQGVTATTLITEPTGVRELLEELTSLFLIDIWWDERDSEIKLRVLQPYETATTLTDDANIVAASLSRKDDTKERVTQIWVYWNYRDPTEPMDESRNFRELAINADIDAESSDEYNDSRTKVFHSRWFNTAGDALRLAGRSVNWLRDAPKRFTFTLDAKDSDEWTGDTVVLDTRLVQSETGANLPTAVRIIETKEKAGGHVYQYVALDDAFSGRYGRIGPNTLGDYDAATDAEKARYAWVAENDAPQLDGDGPYLIV